MKLSFNQLRAHVYAPVSQEDMERRHTFYSQLVNCELEEKDLLLPEILACDDYSFPLKNALAFEFISYNLPKSHNWGFEHFDSTLLDNLLFSWGIKFANVEFIIRNPHFTWEVVKPLVMKTINVAWYEDKTTWFDDEPNRAEPLNQALIKSEHVGINILGNIFQILEKTREEDPSRQGSFGINENDLTRKAAALMGLDDSVPDSWVRQVAIRYAAESEGELDQ